MAFLQENLSFDAAQVVLEHEEGTEGKSLYMKGLCIQGDVKNANQRIYPVNEIANAVKSLKEQIGGGYSVLGELDHPDSSVINLNNVSHNIKKVWWDGDTVMGEVEILSTPAGNILKELFRSGITVGISSRGMGSGEEGKDGILMVQEDFDLLCWDFVSTPSTPGAYMAPTTLKEGVEVPTQNYTKVHNIIRDIICDNTGMCKC